MSDDDFSGDEDDLEAKSNDPLFKVKMWGASKAVQTKLGRKVISHFIGQHGNDLLEIFREVATLDQGPQSANAMYVNVLKLAVKVKMLNDQKLLRKRNFWHVVRAINGLAIKVYHCILLNSPGYLPVDPSEATAEALSRNFKIVSDLLVAMLAPHLPADEIQNLVQITSYYGGLSFLHPLIHSPRMKEFNQRTLHSVKVMVQPLLHGRRFDGHMIELCATPNCPNKRLVQIKPGKDGEGEWAGYKGSTLRGVQEANNAGLGPNSRLDLEPFVATSFCQIHHFERYLRLVQSPNVIHFLLGDGRDYYPMTDLLKQKLGRHIRRFYKATIAFEGCPGHQRLDLAIEIFEAFLGKNVKHPIEVFPPELVTQTEHKLAQWFHIRQTTKSKDSPNRRQSVPLRYLPTGRESRGSRTSGGTGGPDGSGHGPAIILTTPQNTTASPASSSSSSPARPPPLAKTTSCPASCSSSQKSTHPSNRLFSSAAAAATSSSSSKPAPPATLTNTSSNSHSNSSSYTSVRIAPTPSSLNVTRPSPPPPSTSASSCSSMSSRPPVVPKATSLSSINSSSSSSATSSVTGSVSSASCPSSRESSQNRRPPPPPHSSSISSSSHSDQQRNSLSVKEEHHSSVSWIPPVDLFAKLQTIALNTLQTCFKTYFVASGAFQEYVRLYKPADDVIAYLKASQPNINGVRTFTPLLRLPAFIFAKCIVLLDARDRMALGLVHKLWRNRSSLEWAGRMLAFGGNDSRSVSRITPPARRNTLSRPTSTRLSTGDTSSTQNLALHFQEPSSSDQGDRKELVPDDDEDPDYELSDHHRPREGDDLLLSMPLPFLDD